MRTALCATARLLAEARRKGARTTLQSEQRPLDSAEAYAVQDAIGRALAPGGAAIRGWKVGAPSAKSVPTAAPIYEIAPGPARIAASRFI